jgi:hypothetical protein
VPGPVQANVEVVAALGKVVRSSLKEALEGSDAVTLEDGVGELVEQALVACESPRQIGRYVAPDASRLVA